MPGRGLPLLPVVVDEGGLAHTGITLDDDAAPARVAQKVGQQIRPVVAPSARGM